MSVIPAGAGATTELWQRSARDLAALLRSGNVSAREVVAAHLHRIELVDPMVNAVCTLDAERALRLAEDADRRFSAGAATGAMHGVPVVHKDLLATEGLRTTYGSAAYTHHVPTEDALIVARLRAAGAITLGKTNTPQFGTGGHTFNELFGTTRNPFDLSRTAGGSSGGSAAALAAGMAPLATGTDMAGSLRIPASFCNVVGFRPTPGRIPWLPSSMQWFPFVVPGPMARTVDDVVFATEVAAGGDRRAAIRIDTPFEIGPAPRSWRIAFAPQLASLPVDGDVLAAIEQLRGPLEQLGELEMTEPNLEGVDETFLSWRGWYYATNFGALYDERREVLDPFTAANVEEGRRITSQMLGRAELNRSERYGEAVDFFDRWDVLVVPCTPVSPFPTSDLRPTEVAGEPTPSYLDWMRHLYLITVLGVPALSLPIGATTTGLPIGVQLVAGSGQDGKLLRFARDLEQQLVDRKPPYPEMPREALHGPTPIVG